MEIIEILNEMKQLKDFEHGSAQNPEAILSLEQELGFKFPESYIKLISLYGYVSCFKGEVYGISEDLYFDVIKKNKMIREMNLPDDFCPLPKDAFIIEKYLGGGCYLLFDENSDRSGQVSLVLDETFYEEEESWPDLESFLEDYFL